MILKTNNKIYKLSMIYKNKIMKFKIKMIKNLQKSKIMILIKILNKKKTLKIMN